MKIIGVTQARTNSTRFPNKVLMKAGADDILSIHIQRVLNSRLINSLIVATTTNQVDDPISEIGDRHKVKVVRGSEEDVLDRFYQAVKGENADYIVRLTADCPLIDAKLIDAVIEFAVSKKLDYASNTLSPHYPDGQDVEVFKFSALERAWNEAKLHSEREHVTPFIWKNSSFMGGTRFTSDNFDQTLINYQDIRMTVDENKDLELIRVLIDILGKNCSWHEYAEFIVDNPDIRNINNGIGRNEGYRKSLREEK
jgi:spore coat polysaccharide biosynthesis protein SpsF